MRIPQHRTLYRLASFAARRRIEAAFTMVEIAICIAIVAFALVAIVGVLPTGVEVQRSNREDTVINQDGNVWLETIRSGARGMDDLTNYVDLIQITSYRSGVPIGHTPFVFGNGAPYRGTNTFTNGMEIVGLLSTPKYLPEGRRDNWISNTVTAYVRAFSGSAVEKPDGAHPTSRDIAFRYRLTAELVPFSPYAAVQTNFNETGLSQVERLSRSNLWIKAVNTKGNFYDLRLTFDWPVFLSKGSLTVGKNRKTFRTLVSGEVQAFSRRRWGPDAYFFLVRRNSFNLAQ
jgi:hypothetical protein